MKNTTKTSLKRSLIALAIASMPLAGYAAGLGQINVFSGLGQPLHAEIGVNASAQELTTLRANVASPEAFSRAKLTYSPAAAAIQISVDAQTGTPVLRLSSNRPINDPFVELLVELDSSSGRVLREYTILLDPVDLAVPRPLAAAVDTPVAPPPAAASPSPLPELPVESGSYTVQSGDTLSAIAASRLQSGVTLEQMVVALYRANSNAFDGSNMNRLRAGAVLEIPPAEQAQQFSPAQAQQEIRAQAADFESYRHNLASAAARQDPAPERVREQAAEGRIVPRVEETRPQSEEGDQVQVSSGEKAAGTGEAEARLHALEEELAARDRALEEANSRLAQLEASIRDMQKLLELRNAPLAQLQDEAALIVEPELELQAEPELAPPPAVVAAATESEEVLEALLDEMAALPDEGSVAAVSDETATEESAPASKRAAATAAVETDSSATQAKRKRTRAETPPPAPEPDLLESITSNPMMLAGGGGLVALLLAYLGIKRRQRRKVAEETPVTAVASELAPGAAGVFAGTGGQSVDTAQSSILQTDFSQTGLAAIGADEGVDPVAEADVYMAYGRDAQAEEILQDALKADPERAAIYLKLLEIHSQRRDLRQFETLAGELFARTGGEGEEWEKAAAMGRKLDAENPLYAERQSAIEVSTEVADGKDDAEAGAVEVTAAAGAEDGLLAGEDQGASLEGLDFTASAPIEPSQSQMRDTWTVPGELRQYAEGGSEQDGGLPDADKTLAALEEAAPLAEEAGAGLELGSLDFELDLGDEPAAVEAVTTPDAEAEADAGLDLDLDFDLSALAPKADVELTPAAIEPEATLDLTVEEEAAMLATDPAVLADSVEFELPDLELEGPTEQPLSEPLPAAVAPAEDQAAVKPEATVVDIEKTSFDTSLLDFDFDLDSPVPPPASGMAAFDATTVDLDLDGFEAAADDSAQAPVSIEATQLGGFAAAISEPSTIPGELSMEEIDTKLELARAYHDMGDREGANELLQEVLHEGSTSQQDSARELMAQLS